MKCDCLDKEHHHPKCHAGNNIYIPIDKLIQGSAYAVDARNFDIAIWGGGVFHGLRHKFSLTFMDTEEHYDRGAPHGTVKPYKLLE